MLAEQRTRLYRIRSVDDESGVIWLRAVLGQIYFRSCQNAQRRTSYRRLNLFLEAYGSSPFATYSLRNSTVDTVATVHLLLQSRQGLLHQAMLAAVIPGSINCLAT